MELQYLVWPAACVIICIFAMVFFRKPLSSLIGRTSDIGKKGISFKENVSQSIDDKSKKNPDTELIRIFSDNTIKALEDGLKSKLEEEKLATDEEKVARLITIATLKDLTLFCETIYNSIYGSQIQILQSLNTGKILTKETIEPYYNVSKNNAPKLFRDYTLEDFINYMIRAQLIIDKNEQYQISEFGIDFLLYMSFTGKETTKIP